MIALSPPYLKRYKDVAWLLCKYGGTDLVQKAGLAEVLGTAARAPQSEHRGEGFRTEVPPVNGHANGHAAPPAKPLPEQLADDLESLGPAFVKLGQLLSTRPDILPQPYLDALSRLQDKGKPVPWPEIERVLEEEFHTHPDRIFDRFDREPIAAASLGQVYRASLHDGRDVIVKVQRPGIVESLQEDLAALAEMAEVLHNHTDLGRRWQIKPLVATLNHTIANELDYRREARDSHVLAENLRQFDRLVVPQAIDDLTRPRVLTMEHVEGTKIPDVSPVVLVEFDRPAIINQLFRAYLRQVLVDGVFHSDPHPGNLLLTPDGRIAILDFGMITRISPETRMNMVKLLFAISHGDGEDAARIAEAMSQPTPLFKRQEFARRISRLVAEQQDLAVQHMGTGRVIMQIQRTAGETGIIVPESLMMFGKTLMNLDRAVVVLDPKFNPTASVQEQAAEIVKEHSRQHLSLMHVYQALLDTTDLMQCLPGRINTVTRRLADNELEIRVRAFDEMKFIRGLHKVAHRITFGLVLAALMLGASNMMKLDVTPKLLGYPAFPLLLFVATAVVSAVWLWRAGIIDDVEERN